MYGWAGTILKVDLSNGKIEKQPLDPGFARKYLGGEGFGARILWDEVGPEVEDGLDPGNVLIYTSGPLTGTLAPGCGRLEIVTKSPLTGIFGDSNAGGHFAPEFKRAGYDAIVIKGQAAKPVYLWIHDEQVEIKDARHLWGKTVSETDRMIKAELGDQDIQVSCIGPGGENKVRFAILVNNITRAPGWTGCGAVAGAKNLKAVAVRGTGGIKIARPEEFEQACWQAREKVKNDELSKTRRAMGTPHLFRQFHVIGYTPVNNYNIALCSPEYLDQVCGEKWLEDHVVKALGCHGCVVHCGHYATVKDGPYAGLAGEGYEYGCLGAYLYWYGSTSIPFGIAATKYCNENGLDGTEPGMLMAWLTDCFKRGLISAEDTDGLTLDWGDERAGLELLRKMTYREGIGNLLAEGLGRAARKMGRGTEQYAYTVNNRASMEVNIRGSYGCALASATSTRGADHLKGWPYFEFSSPSPEASLKYFGHPKAGDFKSPEGKSYSTVYSQSVRNLIDMVGTCKFHSKAPFGMLDETDYARLVSGATGIEFTAAEMITISNRVYNLEQAYNVRAGLTRRDDIIPEKFFEPAFDRGPLKGFVLEKERFNKMLDDYYELRGWDTKTGIPTRKALEALELKDVADELQKDVTHFS